jgi:hypothetical protein
MRIFSSSTVILAVMSLAACTTPPVVATAPVKAAVAVPKKPSHPRGQARIPNEYLVTLSDDVDEKVIAEHFARFGIKSVSALSGETYLLIVNDDPGPQDMEAMIDDDADFKAIQPNLIYWGNRAAKSGTATK